MSTKNPAHKLLVSLLGAVSNIDATQAKFLCSNKTMRLLKRIGIDSLFYPPIISDSDCVHIVGLPVLIDSSIPYKTVVVIPTGVEIVVGRNDD